MPGERTAGRRSRRPSARAAFSSVCSASMIPGDARARSCDAAAQRELVVRPPPPARPRRPGPRAPRRPRRSAGAPWARSRPVRRAARGLGARTPTARPRSETNGAAAMPSATAVSPLAMPSATASAKQIRETDSISTRPPNSAEALVSRQPAAGEVARRVGERAHDEHVVERRRSGRRRCRSSCFAAGQRDHQEEQREADLDRDRHAQRVLGVAAGPALGDRAREQLFDRAGRSPR